MVILRKETVPAYKSASHTKKTSNRHHVADGPVGAFLKHRQIVQFINRSKVKLYFNVPHFDFHKLWGAHRFCYCKELPMNKALTVSSSLKSTRVWSLDYPFQGGKQAAKGCGVAVYAVVSEGCIYELMECFPDMRVAREVIMEDEKAGYTRFYVDWDEYLSSSISTDDKLQLSIERINVLLAHFRSFFVKRIAPFISVTASMTPRETKLSLHLVFTGVYFKTRYEYKQFDTLFRDTLAAQWQQHVDASNNLGKHKAGRRCLALLRVSGARKALLGGTSLPLALTMGPPQLPSQLTHQLPLVAAAVAEPVAIPEVAHAQCAVSALAGAETIAETIVETTAVGAGAGAGEGVCIGRPGKPRTMTRSYSTASALLVNASTSCGGGDRLSSSSSSSSSSSGSSLWRSSITMEITRSHSAEVNRVSTRSSSASASALSAPVVTSCSLTGGDFPSWDEFKGRLVWCCHTRNDLHWETVFQNCSGRELPQSLF
jgi:sulfur relay (sulfurtransferase) DsrC/TusE family protein